MSLKYLDRNDRRIAGESIGTRFKSSIKKLNTRATDMKPMNAKMKT